MRSFRPHVDVHGGTAYPSSSSDTTPNWDGGLDLSLIAWLFLLITSMIGTAHNHVIVRPTIMAVSCSRVVLVDIPDSMIHSVTTLVAFAIGIWFQHIYRRGIVQQNSQTHIRDGRQTQQWLDIIVVNVADQMGIMAYPPQRDLFRSC